MADFYLKSAFQELFAEDGLLVMGKGLGINSLYGKFAQYYSSKKNGRKVVFCLNCSGIEESLRDYMLPISDDPFEVPQIINNEVCSQDRMEKYAEGGCYIITSRILIVDLLDGKIDATRISGFLVYNAQKISESSIEAFVIRVFRERNRFGFVKAFSEDPEYLQSGFGKVERLLKLLYIKKIYLWPRFRSEIISVLDKAQPEVIELSLGLTSNMKAIQSAILVAMNTCILELKKSAPQLETSQMTLENGLFHAFDYSIRNQLDPDWHRVSIRTKQLVSDLTVLRKLLDYLIRYDAFSFYYLLLKLQSCSSLSSDQHSTAAAANHHHHPSLWLMSEAAEQMFKMAKERVYKVVPLSNIVDESAILGSTTSCNSNSLVRKGGSNKVLAVTKLFKQQQQNQSVINTQLEQLSKDHQLNSVILQAKEYPPKWKLLLEILSEIQQHNYDETATINNNTNNHDNSKASASDTIIYNNTKDGMKPTIMVANDKPSYGMNCSNSCGSKTAAATATVSEENQQNTSSSSLFCEGNKRGSSSRKVLLIVRDGLTLTQLRDIITNSSGNNSNSSVGGIDAVIDQRYRWFISQQAADIRNKANNNKLRKINPNNHKRNATAAAIRTENNNNTSRNNYLNNSSNISLSSSAYCSNIDSDIALHGEGKQNNQPLHLQLKKNKKRKKCKSVESLINDDDDDGSCCDNDMEGNIYDIVNKIQKDEKDDDVVADNDDDDNDDVAEEVCIVNEVETTKQQQLMNIDSSSSSHINSISDELGIVSLDVLQSLPMENQLILVQEIYLRSSSNANTTTSATAATITTSANSSTTVGKEVRRINNIFDVDTSSSVFPSSSAKRVSSDDRNYYKDNNDNDGDASTTPVVRVFGEGSSNSFSIIILTHNDVKQQLRLLEDLEPTYIILYDPEISLIRRLETYQASIAPTSIKVYFMMYEGSVEEHRYVGALSKEKKAFESLITAKEHMVISLPDHPMEQRVMLAAQEQQSQLRDSRHDNNNNNHYHNKQDTVTDTGDVTISNVGTSYHHHHQNTSSVLRKIVVDVREFRSPLPAMLHTGGTASTNSSSNALSSLSSSSSSSVLRGFTIVPRTLQTGDYILSPEICIERKGISDLFQSFASGRLYNQVETMSKYYKFPCLLIEFHADKPFALTAANEITAEIQQYSITTRLSLLTLSFPNLRILWSRSAAHTVDIFRSIVINHAEVDVNKAVCAGGVNNCNEEVEEEIYNCEEENVTSITYNNNKDSDKLYNEEKGKKYSNDVSIYSAGGNEELRQSAKEILLSLPGINVHNFRSVMQSVSNLAELGGMSETQLIPLLGPGNAKKLRDFFQQHL